MMRPQHDDLFQDSTMTFGEHLEELRGALVRAGLGLVVGLLIGCYFGNNVVAFIQTPLIRALETYYQEQSLIDIRQINGTVTPEQAAALIDWDMVFELVYVEKDALRRLILDETATDISALPIFQPADPAANQSAELTAFAQTIAALQRVQSRLPAHLRGEFQWRVDQPAASLDRFGELILGIHKLLRQPDLYTPAAFPGLSEEMRSQGQKLSTLTPYEVEQFNRRILVAAYPRLAAHYRPQLSPMLIWRSVKNDNRLKPKSLNVQEGFMIWFQASLLLAVVISSPWVFYQLWTFVAAGLYPHERSYVYIFLPFSLGLFLLGASTAFFFVFDPVLEFLLDFNRSLGIDPDPRINEWLGFALLLPLGFGISFQLPLVMLFLQRIGIVTVEMYLEKWRIAILVITVLSAVLTPADPYSIFLLMIPLILLYFGGIGLCMLWPKTRRDGAGF
ncbi:MAG: twin-arginine translocase subunit TatC [Pirellulales bacterium]|nr:twin-arginine translocase subunit TatC [Pirellulales bacterium]